MDIIVTMFYVGGVSHMVRRERSFLQCMFWPLSAGREFCAWLDDVVNARNTAEEGKQ